jgi:hypothetical protein
VKAAAAKISQFIKEIESQLGWTTQLPWSAGSIEQRRFDALRLLRQSSSMLWSVFGGWLVRMRKHQKLTGGRWHHGDAVHSPSRGPPGG